MTRNRTVTESRAARTRGFGAGLFMAVNCSLYVALSILRPEVIHNRAKESLSGDSNEDREDAPRANQEPGHGERRLVESRIG